MLGLEYGSSAYTIASHTVLLMLTFVVAVSIMRTFRDGRWDAVKVAGMPEALAFFFFCFGIERLYYDAARLLVPFEVDLWSAHPGPELLSGILAVGLFGLLMPMRASKGGPGRFRWMAFDAAVYISIWVLLAGALY